MSASKRRGVHAGQRPVRAPTRRRSAVEVREAALEAGRALLIAGGPDAVTLKGIGAALGVTHANVLHHFGTADRFRAALRDRMVADLADRMAVILQRTGGEGADLAAVVDETFAAYAEGGIGRLVAWLQLHGEGPVDVPLAVSMEQLVGVVRQALGDQADPALPVALLSMLAFAGSIMGGDLGRLLGVEPAGFRALAVRLLVFLARDPRRVSDVETVGDARGPG